MTSKWIVTAKALLTVALLVGGWILLFRGLWILSRPLGMIGLGAALVASAAMRLNERRPSK